MGRGAGRITVVGAALVALAVAGCGSGGTHFANIHRPPQPIDLTAYVDNNHVSISPDHFGGGPVQILVTNEAAGTETLNLVQNGKTVATSHAIGSDATATIQKSLSSGSYELTAGGKILAAKITVTQSRPSADNALLQP